MIFPFDWRRAGRAALAWKLLALALACALHLGVCIAAQCSADSGCTYKFNQTEEIHVKALPPLIRIGNFNLAHLSKDAVVKNHSVQPAESLHSGVDGFLCDGEICQVAVYHLDLVAVLLF